jgi:hypothetical protein
MANEQIVQQAAAAAATPANAAPAPVGTTTAPTGTWEEQRRAIMANPLYFTGDGPESKALREQMRAHLANAPADEPPVAPKEEVKTKSEAPVNDARRLEITELLVLKKYKDSTERAGLERELRQILAAQESPEEREARGNLTVRERRAEFGVKEAPLHGPELESYNQNFAGHETALFDVARENGLDAGQVRGLRDEAIKLGQIIGERGQPASDDEVKQIFERLRVPASSRASLLRLWRQVEGGAA